jgi:hypothetical protein
VVSNNTINGLMDDDDDVDVCQASSNVPPKWRTKIREDTARLVSVKLIVCFVPVSVGERCRSPKNLGLRRVDGRHVMIL